jgi:membrane protein implicated in regulation of membrane protease activity
VPDRKRDDAWFVYERRVGEIRAEPADARGWFALVGAILGTTALALGVFFALFHRSPLLAGLAMGAVIVAGVLGTIWLAVAKGRRVDERDRPRRDGGDRR